MEYLKRLINLFILLIFILPGSIEASDNKILYVKVDYYKALPGAQGQYVNLELDLWKPLHEERYNRGIIKSWDFYQVMAGDSDAAYDYITINVFDDFDMIDYFDLEDIITSVYPEKDMGEVMQQTYESREVVHTEIWQINGQVIPEIATTVSGNYLTINYFDSRNGSGEHMEMELDFWGRIHETRVEKNILNSWAMYTLIYPGSSGSAQNYTYSTIDYYDTLGDTREPVGAELAKLAHPDLTEQEIEEFMMRTGDSRTTYKVELWKRLGSIGDQSGY